MYEFFVTFFVLGLICGPAILMIIEDEVQGAWDRNSNCVVTCEAGDGTTR